MKKLDALYQWLAKAAAPEADQILGAALALADGAYAARLASVLLDRRGEAAWIALVANFPRVPVELRPRLLAEPELLRAAAAAVLATGSPNGRRAALTLLELHPSPQLAEHLADLLRDPDESLRTAAAALLRRYALHVLEPGKPAGDPDTARLFRGHVTRALAEALRTFDAHGRPEVLEAALWFARELGETLWTALAEPRSQRGRCAAQHLRTWNSPRLAAFLLLGLARPEWRTTVRPLLEGWSGRTELVALLRNTELLEDPQVRRGLRHLRTPAWFSANVGAPALLPPDVRGALPLWVRNLGFTDAERLHYLTQWQTSALPDVHRAAVYALASLPGAGALRVLVDVAGRRCPMSRFARWFVAGARTLAQARRPTAAPPVAEEAV